MVVEVSDTESLTHSGSEQSICVVKVRGTRGKKRSCHVESQSRLFHSSGKLKLKTSTRKETISNPSSVFSTKEITEFDLTTVVSSYS